MKYLVMEVHPAYVIVLDEKGCFLKAANRGYQTGQTVTDVILLKDTPSGKKGLRIPKSITVLAAAACLFLALIGTERYFYVFASYAQIQMQINPSVQLDVSRSHRVVGITALNKDGASLIDDYDYHGKDYTTVADELADRAISMGFLAPSGEIVISVSGGSSQWKEQSEKQLSQNLEEHLKDYTIVIVVSPGSSEDSSSETQNPSSQPAVNTPSAPLPADSYEDADDMDDIYEDDDDADDDSDDMDDDVGDIDDDDTDDDVDDIEDDIDDRDDDDIPAAGSSVNVPADNTGSTPAPSSLPAPNDSTLPSAPAAGGSVVSPPADSDDDDDDDNDDDDDDDDDEGDDDDGDDDDD